MNMRLLIIIWMALMLLTAIGYFGRNSAPDADLAALMIPFGAAAIKVALLSWYFMELRSVSRFWAVGLAGMLSLFFLVVAVLQSS